MQSLLIKHQGNFMTQLLTGETFDSFLLEEAQLRTAATWQLDGRLNREFYDTEVWDDPAQRPYDYLPWSEVRGALRDLIKGKRAPAGMQFVLMLKPEFANRTLRGASDPSIRALLLTIRSDGSQITVLSGVDHKTFSMDKEPDRVWDEAVKNFLTSKGIEYEEL